MRILLLSPFVPDVEAAHGGGIYLGSLARALANHATLGLVALDRDGASRPLDPAVWQWHGVLHHRDRPQGPGRTTHRMRMLWHWRHLPLVAAKHWHPELPPLLDRARREFRPDVVLVELAQMAQYLHYLRDLPTILTDHESGCPANTTTGLGPWGDRRDTRLWRRYVQRFYPLASLVQAVTTEDAASLRELLGTAVEVRPPTYRVPPRSVAPGDAPARALFLGDYSHGPNPEAAARLVHDVLPLLRAANPDAELWLAGPNEERVRSLATTPGVRVLGFVPDLPTLFGQVRLLLAPLWSGGGFRMKSLAALAHGLPVVTNALGARGCSAAAPARTVVEGPRALADAALRLLGSRDAAAAAGRAAFEWAQRNLTGEAVAALQLERAQRLLGAAAR